MKEAKANLNEDELVLLHYPGYLIFQKKIKK